MLVGTGVVFWILLGWALREGELDREQAAGYGMTWLIVIAGLWVLKTHLMWIGAASTLLLCVLMLHVLPVHFRPRP